MTHVIADALMATNLPTYRSMSRQGPQMEDVDDTGTRYHVHQLPFLCPLFRSPVRQGPGPCILYIDRWSGDCRRPGLSHHPHPAITLQEVGLRAMEGEPLPYPQVHSEGIPMSLASHDGGDHHLAPTSTSCDTRTASSRARPPIGQQNDIRHSAPFPVRIIHLV